MDYKECVAAVRAAQYGADVREPIADALGQLPEMFSPGEKEYKEVSGADVHIEDGVPDHIRLSVYGKIEQKSTRGYQILRGTEKLWEEGFSKKTWAAEGWQSVISGDESLTVSRMDDNTLVTFGVTGANAIASVYQRGLPLEDGKTYTLSCMARGTAGLRLLFHDNDGYHTNNITVTNEYMRYSYTFTVSTPYSAGYEVLLGTSAGSQAGSTMEIHSMMLEEGDTAHSYEVYTGMKPAPNIDYLRDIISVGDDGSIDVMVDDGHNNDIGKHKTVTIPLTDPLRGIPVDTGGNITVDGQQYIADIIMQKDGKYGIDRHCGMQVFDGSADEGWSINSGTTIAAKKRVCTDAISDIVLRPISNADVAHILCDQFVPKSSLNTYQMTEGISVQDSGRISIYAETYSTSDVSLWKTYLSEHPMTLVYELAEPMWEEFGDEVQALLQSLYTYDGVTDITTDDQLQPMLSVRYVVDNGSVHYFIPEVEQARGGYDYLADRLNAQDAVIDTLQARIDLSAQKLAAVQEVIDELRRSV